MSLKEILELLLSLFRFASKQKNPVRQQASRVLRVFEAHGISRTQINRVVPQSLRLPSIKWSNPDELKGELTQDHLDWVQKSFALEADWLDGLTDEGNLEIPSYKSPKDLHDWLQANRTREEGLNFRLCLVTSSDTPYDEQSEGNFALVLEQLVDLGNHESLSRFYHLNPGAHFTHQPSVLHLAQVLAIAYHHGAMMRRLKLKPQEAYELSHNRGLIVEWISVAETLDLQADHEFWEHFSGVPEQLVTLRERTEKSLIDAGLTELVAGIHYDRERFMRRGVVG